MSVSIRIGVDMYTYRKHIGFLYLLLFTGLIPSCDVASSEAPDDAFELRIEDSGLPFFHLGESFFKLDSVDIPYPLTEVQLLKEDGYVWMMREMVLDTGKIVFEGDFFDESRVTEELLQESSLSRIRVESPMLQLENGIKTGMTYGRLKSHYPESTWELTYIPNYKMVDIMASESASIHFLVPGPPTLFPDSLQDFIEVSPEGLPEDLEIAGIVLL